MSGPLKLAVVLSFFLAAAAHAGEVSTHWSGKSPARSRLILESSETVAGVNRAGIHIKMERGWYTYWRQPGATGMPPYFDWTGSQNLAESPETIWPVPLRAIAYGESLNLYKDEVVFPVEFRAADPTKPVKLRLKITYGVCRDMCVPSWAEHEITVYPSTGARTIDEDNAELIAAFSVRQPSADPQATGLEIREVRTIVDDGKVILTIRIRGLSDDEALVLVEGPQFLRMDGVTPTRTKDGRPGKLLKLKLGPASKFRALNGKRIRITVIDGHRALEQVWVVGAHGSSAVGVGLTPLPRDKPEPWGGARETMQ